MNLGLTGKNAIVTGGSHGIGLQIALSLATQGCNVSICSRSKDRVKAAVKEIEEKNVRCIGDTVDVLQKAAISKYCEHVVEEWGSVHILINNVGGGGRWGSESVVDTPDKTWSEVYDKNVGAAIRFSRKVIPIMQKQKWGRVVTISSTVAREADGRPWYVVAKSAELSLMKALAVRKEFARNGITFNTVSPGAVMIPDTGWEEERTKNSLAFDEMLDKHFPLGRMGSVEEVANVVLFLCSEQASFVNGANIVVDGGQSKSY